MSRPTKPSRPTSGAPASVFLAGWSIVGDLHSTGRIRIDCRVDGNVTADEIEIGPLGIVTGDVRCRSIVIEGRILGTVTCGAARLSRHANVSGSLHYDTVQIEKGATMDVRLAQIFRARDVQPLGFPYE